MHVHAPGTKLNDGYEKQDGELDWPRFCRIIHDSDVWAIGICDYFSLDSFFAFKEQYDQLYPNSDKVFFPNLELRLNETVNPAQSLIDLHVVFPPDLSRADADAFLTALKTQRTDSRDRKLSCADLSSGGDYQSASVSRDDLKTAIEDAYGKRAVWTDHVLLFSAVNNNGIRPDTSSQRKMMLSDETDKISNAFFGNPSNRAYFLNPDRLEDSSQRATPKPVFAGCDAHSFDELQRWLGHEASGDNVKHVTWVKADLAFEGLQQTLVEPAERVRICPNAPDKKEPYKVISKIKFSDTPDFPSEVVFNPGLNAIIGSRSSGKSALLAYIAHAVDPDYVVEQQVLVAKIAEKDAGPAASITWADVKDFKYEVEWATPEATTGRVIYIPQNSLYRISGQPDEITAKVQPTVFRADPAFEAKFRKIEYDTGGLNESIRAAVSEWFSLSREIQELDDQIKGLGDRSAVAAWQAELSEKIKALREASSLSEDELEEYQRLVERIGGNEARIAEIVEQQRILAPYVRMDESGTEYRATDEVSVSVTMTPSPGGLPEELRVTLNEALGEVKAPLLADVQKSIAGYRLDLDLEHERLLVENDKLRKENHALIEKNLANVQISGLVNEQKAQTRVLAEIDKRRQLLEAKAGEQRDCVQLIETHIRQRDEKLGALADDFNASRCTLEGMQFTIEVEHDEEDLSNLSSQFNRSETSPYLVERARLDAEKINSNPGEFISYVASGRQKLRQGVDAEAATRQVLTLTKDIRFVASLEGDRIGGFKTSSMTPGKQALFALTLILAETGEPWPLLIDQPEDDLDSRSVCDVIVKDLMTRKRERQIIMVSHNANLVIGADSEEVIVANRHGDDRQNRDGRMFEYLTGSLEHSQPKDASCKLVLESQGIREHSCEILDGGEEAFQKRKDKYRI